MTFRLWAVGTILLAGVAAGYVVLGAGLDTPHLARWLAAHGYPGYAAWLWWVVLAPVVLGGAALVARRTPWPWVVGVSLYLAALVAGQARLAHLTHGWVWAAVGAVVAVGLASIVSALGD